MDLVQLENLSQHFVLKKYWFKNNTVLKAVDKVSFSIQKGETFGLVGESGCGKSTLGRAVLRLYDPTSGKIIFDGNDITQKSQGELRPLRKRMQMIFQDPYASLNPKMTIEQILEEPLSIHNLFNKPSERRNRILQLLSLVGLRTDLLKRYPHEFSGGQRQRVGIARALAVQPDLIVCDEPISALDVSIQGQIVNLLKDLQDTFNLTYLFIAHDLAIVKHISDRVGVMYLGNMVEIGKASDVYQKPLHPYTQALLSAAPTPNPRVSKKRIILQGEIPSPIHPPSGCKFHTRCPKVMPICKTKVPTFETVEANRQVACHLYTAL